MIAAVPGLAHELQTVRRRLEVLFRDAQDFEFTVQDGQLWLLQTRNAQRTDWAALQIACDLVDEHLIDEATALQRLQGIDLDNISRIGLAGGGGTQPIGRGIPAGTGVTSGRAAMTADEARRLAEAGDSAVLVRQETSTADISGLARCRGLVTATGARTSHAAVVARQLGVVAVVGCRDLSIDLPHRRFRIGSRQFDEGALITVDGGRGLVYEGELEVHLERPVELLEQVRAWQRQSGRPAQPPRVAQLVAPDEVGQHGG